jgi:hypothetical protein
MMMLNKNNTHIIRDIFVCHRETARSNVSSDPKQLLQTEELID